MHAIGIDVGSTNVKVSLIDEDGAVVGAAGRPLRTAAEGERVGQDADALWAAVCSAVAEVTAGASDAAG
jgi:sugar (pentulose or hexulose) kinase